MIKRPAYQCEFCKKLYVSMLSCTKHEKRCQKNPDNIPACFDCKHLNSYTRLFYKESLRHNSEGTAFNCPKINAELRSPKLDATLALLVDDYLQDTIRMPLSCDQREVKNER